MTGTRILVAPCAYAHARVDMETGDRRHAVGRLLEC